MGQWKRGYLGVRRELVGTTEAQLLEEDGPAGAAEKSS
jgi:hypothetical protein